MSERRTAAPHMKRLQAKRKSSGVVGPKLSRSSNKKSSGEDERAGLIERALSLVPLLRANAAETETSRRIPAANLAAIDEAGLFKVTAPRRFGGLEVDIRTKLEVSRALAQGCGSTAWVTAIMNGCAWITGLASAEAQQDVWGDSPSTRVIGVFAPTAETRWVKGGLVVNGKWRWASGCLHADWVFLGIPIVDRKGNVVDIGMGLAKLADLTVEETWFAAGMKGTGSNTLHASDLFVPRHRILSVPHLFVGDTPTPYAEESLYRSSFDALAGLVLIGPQLGLATAALDLVLEKAPSRGITYTRYTSQSVAPTVQLAVAEAATLIDTAHMHAYRAAADVDTAAREDRLLTATERARIRMDTGYVARTSREAIRILCSAHGASSFAESNPLQRIWRDSEVSSRHAAVNPEISSEIYGRALLGLDPAV